MLSIKKSQIPMAGDGLWAERNFKRGEFIVRYDGEKISKKECERRNSMQEGYGGYYLFIAKNKCIDAQHTITAHGRYANDAAGLCRIAGLKNNARYELVNGEPFIKASRNISAGEEILVSYGRGYWNTMRQVMGR
jgi:SET domain-containing protein